MNYAMRSKKTGRKHLQLFSDKALKMWREYLVYYACPYHFQAQFANVCQRGTEASCTLGIVFCQFAAFWHNLGLPTLPPNFLLHLTMSVILKPSLWL